MKNELARLVDDFIVSHGIRKSFIAEKLGMSQQLFYKLLAKKNFTVDDANRILNVIGYEITYQVKRIDD